MRRVYSALFLSGLAALVHEVMWVRLLGEMFGHTLFAVQTVLTIFFLGIALGAWLISRMRIERPFAAFALIEIGIGLWGAALPWIVRLLTVVYDRYAPLETETFGAVAARLAITIAALLVPATLMGATFPLVASAIGNRVAAVYAINTLGGAAGVWLTAFAVLPRIGVIATIYAAVALNIGAAALVWTAAAPAAASQSRGASRGRKYAVLLFLTGMSALALEFLWTRALEQILSGTIYTFATVLAVFLAGIAIGGFVMQRLAPSRALLAGVLSALAFSIVLTPAIVLVISRIQLRSGPWGESLIAAALLLVPTTLMGMSFPLLLSLGGGSIGRLTAANTTGSVVGPFIAGFVLLPLLGLRTSIVVFAILTALVAIAAAERRAVPIAALLATIIVAPLVTRPLRIAAAEGERVIAYRDDTAATVAVVRRGEEQRLKVNNTYSLGGGSGVFTERRQGHLPMLLHPNPRRVLVLGVGTANTLGAIALHRPEQLVAVELQPGVLDFAARYFAATNYGVLRDPRVRVVAGDATRLVRSAPETFDVIAGDLFHPWQAGVSALYSAEHFQHVRARLARGGIFVQWLPLYQLSTNDVRTITRTFLGAFPHTQAWLGNFGASTPIVALVGSETPIAWPATRWETVMRDARVVPYLREVYLDHDVERFASFVCDRALLEQFAGAGAINSNARPLIEFSAARALFAERLEAEKRNSLEQFVRLAAAQDRRDRARGARDAHWFDHRLAVRAFIITFVALEQGNWRAAAEGALIAAEKSAAYELPRKTLSAIGWEILPADRQLAAKLFEAALRWNPDDARARDGLERAHRSM
ncbi:MAG TPA: fused MFS/spermidine synthase [Thermoanaerobaculia bacterium]|nr:fused MFS/spermidine synthase [Thermoanaerobaculia bacterium]